MEAAKNNNESSLAFFVLARARATQKSVEAKQREMERKEESIKVH